MPGADHGLAEGRPQDIIGARRCLAGRRARPAPAHVSSPELVELGVSSGQGR